MAVVTFGGVFATTDYTYAQPSLQDVQKEKKEVKNKLSKAEQEIADILYEIKDIDTEIKQLELAIETNEEELRKNEEKIEELEDEIDALNEQIDKRMEVLKDRISSYQDSGGTINLLEVVLGAKGFNDMISQVSAVTTITKADQNLIQEIEEDVTAVQEKVEEAEVVNAEIEDQVETLELQKEEQKESKEKIKKKQKDVEKKISKLKSKSSELSSIESEILASISTPAPSSNSNTSSNSSSNSSNSDNGGGQKLVPYTGGGGSAISAGKQFIGNSKYSYGAKNPGAGLFDCSGFVQWAYEQEGVSLPRTASAMSNVGTKVSLSEAKPGDLVFFRGGGHVGIYLGGGKFLGSQNSTGVAIADMNSGYWKEHFDGNVRRIK